MKQFFRKHAKLLFFGLLLIIALIGYLNYFSHKLLGIGCQPEPRIEVVVDDWSDTLAVSGYEPAVIEEPDLIDDDEFPETVEPIIYASGTVQDSVIVEISVVETPDNQTWIKATVGGEEVVFTEVQRSPEANRCRDNDWSLLACGQFADGLDFGAGVSWEPLQVLGSRAGLSVIVDTNRDILTSPDWIAFNARLSRRMGAISIGLDCGYSIGDRRGLAVGLSAGVALGF